MKRLTILFIGLLIAGSSFAQQSTQYSQYMFNGLYINPAYAGYQGTLNLNTYYRSQWTGMPGGPQTMGLAVDGLSNNEKVGLGLNIIHDKLGSERNLALYANYAYRVRMGLDPSKQLAFGIGVGFQNSGFNKSSVVTGDPEVISIGNSFLPDARVGVFYSSLTFFAGLGADNLISSVLFNDKNNSIPPVRQFYLNVGGIIPLSNDILLKPSTLIKQAQRGDNRALTTDLNAAVIFAERFTIGATYRTALSSKITTMDGKPLPKPNSMIALMEIRPTSNIRVGYSFDYTLGGIQTYTGGTHEISISYAFDRQEKRVRTPRYF